jgi:hypothetical protein
MHVSYRLEKMAKVVPSSDASSPNQGISFLQLYSFKVFNEIFYLQIKKKKKFQNFVCVLSFFFFYY